MTAVSYAATKSSRPTTSDFDNLLHIVVGLFSIAKKKFMSLNATLMYASKRTYPEISFPVVYLALKYSNLRKTTTVRR